MSTSNDFLVEVGTEELPPKALRSLMEAFGENLTKVIDGERLAHGASETYSSPRRLAVKIYSLVLRQEDRTSTQKGPPTKIAFDADSNPTPAAIAFAKKCGVGVSDLDRNKTEKGEWLFFEKTDAGRTAAELMPDLVERALDALPIPRRMRWGARDAEFVRPIHWVVMLHGETVIESTVMGIATGRQSQGHRYHSSGPVEIRSPESYLATLEQEGFVIADFARRREMVRNGVEAQAEIAGGTVVNGESLYDEVASLVEWPVAILGSFEAKYLELPREAVISTLTSHQRYFAVANERGELLPKFITVANLESKDPDQVRDGNERVIRPRLADAAFFWDSDRKRTLASRQDLLREVVYQRDLGSLFDKSQRMTSLAKWLAAHLDIDGADLERAAALAKCDLLTGMVGEFPELQGTMGRYYALADDEKASVAVAIEEHYRPRFAGDELPASAAGQVLGVADKVDSLAGVFSIGKAPSGNRDPFGLRRAALGVVRILVECGLDIDLTELICEAVRIQPKNTLADDEITSTLHEFVADRLKRYFLDRDSKLTAETFESVMIRKPASLVDFDRRLAAVQTFQRLEQAESLAAANKRIANILRKAGDPAGHDIDQKLLRDDAEKALFSALDNAQQKVAPMLEVRNYAEVLNALADLRDPVDRFFDGVLVMDDDVAVRNNRLALLGELRALFLNVADISRLSIP